MMWAVAVLDDKLEPLGKLGVVSSRKIHLILQLNDTLLKQTTILELNVYFLDSNRTIYM